MTTLLLRLAGPMQAWGDGSRFSRRATGQEPTKSGVVGLLAAAGGRRRTDPIEDLAALEFGVRVDQRGVLQRDFQTAHKADGTALPLTHRYYLSDAVFVAAVSGNEDLVGGLAQAVQAPVFPLSLGRRAFAPSEPIFMGTVVEPVEDALRAVEWQAKEWYRHKQSKVVHLELALDARPTDHPHDLEAHRDLPVSFDPVRRVYGWRDVVRPEPVAVTNPDGREGPDFLAALGGF